MSELIGIFLIWNMFGAAAAIPLMLDGCLSIVNPACIYKHLKVNWFGAIVLATICGLICPIATIGYWFYKLCTVGRR